MSTFDNVVAGRATMEAAASTPGAIIARLERLPANSMQIRARVLIGTATFFDGFDVITIAATLPLLIHKWGLLPTQIGMLIASGAIGQLIGAFLFPALAEKHGRVKAIAWSSAVIGITSIACGFAPTFEVFVLLRILQGLGLGGELPVAATYINEITRAHGRGRFVLLYEIVFPIGLLVSMALGAWLVPRFGWEIMYFVGGLPLILSLVLTHLVPESPRWLASRGRLAEAGRAVGVFEGSVRGELPPVTQVAAFDELVRQHPKRRMSDLFSAAYRKRTLAVATLWATCGFIQYGLSTWLPTIYKNFYHAPLQLALNLAVIGSVMGVLGSLASALLVDKLGRKPVIVWSFVLCALSLALAGIYHASSVYVVAIFCSLSLGLMASGFITAYVYTPEQYPTSIRASGCGLGSAWLKIASFVAPMVVPHAIIGGNLAPAFYLIGVVPLIAALTVHFVGIETKGKVLEALEA
ncbi:MFS transporter [Burkholderia cenocepacia]|uniref:MFS transporter n=1 Tax=Burkholderia cenocepacia TaxID=95486 RepID=A0ABD4U6H6_9BURK|nr:MFS transporter [Burkholderia cenocepacia]MCW3604665.1 MFS transporter [Burkholderia cenocepacia]MCW3687889.1 MFS transporter [Burkholderia cenocepacia]MCW3694163.1 MFS transporter [Burkholderia cenocepacia]MCW3702610.1 MFS transporter [Burkholderia cenocepacia]MCW3709880.1 MFS transporter [Burkholderia cenocepacia]